MKKITKIIFFTIVGLLSLSTVGAGVGQAQPSAKFDRAWVDYNIREGSVDGMRIHVKFTANNLKSTDCQVRIAFYQDDEVTPLKDNNQNYYTTKGFVAVFRDLKPAAQTEVYEDYQIFMPYNELDLSYGEHKLKMDIDLIYKDGELIQHLFWYPFVYSKKPSTADNQPTATIDKIWIDQDVTESGLFGMRVHAKFRVKNMKDVNGSLAVYFERDNGTRLKSYDQKFQSVGNDVAVYKSIKPELVTTDDADLNVFIPYSELHLTKGEHNLRVDVDLISDKGVLIQHLGFQNFRYWKQ